MNLDEEIICGFNVSTARKLLWQIELDMVKEVIRICNKYDIKYFGIGGTLLGAIRHGGYIPWDDDIDLGMFREDYEKFISIAPYELPEKYFLQSYLSEKKYTNGHIKIRNNATTCLLKGSSYVDLKIGKNCGVFVDIFPYDNVPDSLKQRNKFTERIKRIKRWIERDRFYNNREIRSLNDFIKKALIKTYFIFHNSEKLIKKIDILSQKYKNKTNTVAMVSFMPGREKTTYDLNLYKEFLSVHFQDIQLVIPKNYEAILTRQYGNYMKLPEIKDGSGSTHGICFYDLNQSYVNYKNLSKEEFDKLFEIPSI